MARVHPGVHVDCRLMVVIECLIRNAMSMFVTRYADAIAYTCSSIMTLVWALVSLFAFGGG